MIELSYCDGEAKQADDVVCILDRYLIMTREQGEALQTFIAKQEKDWETINEK